MALTYPLSLPSTGVRSIRIRKQSVVGVAQSPYTGQRQVIQRAGQWWGADVTLPPMKASGDAEKWASFLVGLNGREGTFLLGDTANTTPRGVGLSAALISASPAINNGGFETAGGGGADVFTNWVEGVAGTSTVNRDTSVFRSGAASCRFDIDASNSSANVLQNTVLVVGRRYRVTLWARNEGGTAGVDVTDGATVHYLTGALTASFAQHSVEFIATGTLLNIRRVSAASQSIWIDDVQLEPLDTYGGLVKGASQAGYDLITDGWLAGQTILKAGDWIQLGSGATSRLHKVMKDANTGTNLLLRSEEFDNAAWTKTDTTVTANAWTAPDGATTADLMTQGSAGTAFFSQAATVASGATACASLHLRRSNNDWVRVSIANSSNNAVAYFNLSTGAMGVTGDSGTGVFVDAGIEDTGSGWYRCHLVGSLPAITSYSISVRAVTASGNSAPVNGGSVFAWGAQLESASFAGPYHPTVATAKTVADEATLTLWPKLRASPADNAVITVTNCKGVFALSDNVTEWDIDVAKVYGIGFSCVEVLT